MPDRVFVQTLVHVFEEFTTIVRVKPPDSEHVDFEVIELMHATNPILVFLLPQAEALRSIR